jgi:flagellar protein FlaF
VAVTVENDGNEKILLSDYDNIDVISQYTSSGSTYANWNKYTSSDVASLNANEWTNVSIFPDSINPGIFDPGEELDIMIKIPGVGSADTCWIQVTTPYGKSSAQMATIP